MRREMQRYHQQGSGRRGGQRGGRQIPQRAAPFPQAEAPASGGYGGGPRRPRRRGRRLRPWARWALLGLAVLVVAGGGLFLLLRDKTPKMEPPYVIALDAGHGGDDVGAEGIIGETELTDLTIQKLYALLDADEDFKPVLTKDYGEGATPRQRAKAARHKGAVMLFSVHGNASDDTSASGFECFPAPPGREHHQQSLRLATLVAGQMEAAGARLRGEGGVRYAYYDEDGNKTFREASDTNEYTEGSFTVVDEPGCIALLAEQCFITNEGDVARFAGEAGCTLAAECYYRAIVQFFDTL